MATLRRRMHILERAHSDLSSHSHDMEEPDQEVDTSVEYETPSGSDSSESASVPASPLCDSPQVDHGSACDADPSSRRDPRQQPTPTRRQTEPLSTSQRPWYLPSLAVFAALVPPVGNLLTGGDEIRNLLFIVLLMWYLHQIVEVPWNLYQKSCSRILPPSNGERREESIRSEEAERQLTRLSFIFLSFSSISPFLGSLLLQHTLALVAGRDVLSWFSTSVFIMATGVRPWRECIERISSSVDHLQHVAYQPQDSQLEDLRDQVGVLKTQLVGLERQMREGQDETFEYVDDSTAAVEQGLKRHERRCERWEGKMRDMEVVVEGLRGRVKRLPMLIDTAPSLPWPLNVISGASSKRVRYPPSASLSPRYSLQTLSTSEGLDTIPEEDGAPKRWMWHRLVGRIPVVGGMLDSVLWVVVG